MPVRPIPSLLALAVAAALGACGDEPPAYSAEEFVLAVNREGAGLALGPRLPTSNGSHEVFSATFVDDAETRRSDNHKPEHGHRATVSLVVTGDDEAAIAEAERCETAVSLVCFRADNVVAYMEAGDPHLVERLAGAIRRVAAE